MGKTARLLDRLSVLLAIALVGCASEEQVLTSDPSATRTPPLDGGLPTVLPPRDLDARANTQTELDAIAADASPVATAPEICDGRDNDGNGTIDDVDVGQDGVCDCLTIATLGIPGGSGVGDVFGGWLDTRSESGADDLGDDTLTPELLDRYQVIVAQDLHNQDAYTAAELDALQAWVEAGGGLLTLVGYSSPTERTNVNQVLARFGLSYAAAPILARNGAKSVPVTTWVEHPVTAGVTRVGVDNGYEVEGSGATLASEAGFDLLKAQKVGLGHVIAWGDEWITYDSEWKNNADYQVEQLWLNMIKWLTAERICQVPPTYL
jgi:hypothetical protein